MILENAAYLWLLLLLPLLIILIWWNRRRIISLRRTYFHDELFKSLNQGYWKLGEKIRLAGLYLSLACFIVALAGPKVGTEVREIKRQGVDMLIALDLSSSMNAEDIKPSRLDKAKYEINRLIDRLRGDRVGLIIFTGEAYLQSPLTLDYSALRLFLNIANTDQLPSSSTEIHEALEVAVSAFESETDEQPSEAAKVLLVVSDGENHSTEYKVPLSNLVDNNISVFTLGIGTRTGSNIPLYDEETGTLIGYKRDKEGKTITSKLNPNLLQTIAQEGNGQYYEIQRGSEGIDAFLGQIDEMEKGEFSSQEYADFKNQYQLVAGTGLFFLMIYLTVPHFKKPKND